MIAQHVKQNSDMTVGCIVSGSSITGSLLFSGVKVHSYTGVKDSVILPNVDIGRHCRIKKAVMDKRCKIPPHTIIGEDREEDAKRFFVTENGVVLVTPEKLGQDIRSGR